MGRGSKGGARGRAVAKAFARACPLPTAGDVERWCGAHPGHRAAIVGTAADLLEADLRREARQEEGWLERMRRQGDGSLKAWGDDAWVGTWAGPTIH